MANMNSVYVCMRVCVGEKEREKDRQMDRWGLEKKDPSNIRTAITVHI